MINRCFVFLLVSFSVVLLSGCTGNTMSSADYDKASAGGRYTILKDHAPDHDVKVDHLPNLVPKWESKSRGGNKSPYEVWGKKYWVMKSAKGYVAEGTASWYGMKFHGHTTSNGETYDMYAFSAAHKSLPLPTYLKVTNLDNQRSVIVRVNDRGPFHGNRLIDLSYAAAVRLGYQKKGLARVRIEAITPPKGGVYRAEPTSSSVTKKEVNPPIILAPSPVVSVPKSTKETPVFTHLQLGAFSTKEAANRLKQQLFSVFDTQVNIEIVKQNDALYKVLVGPYASDVELSNWQDKLHKAGFAKPVRVAM
ncbi:septal ring lytic transglycosylase RlpA family protein [Marinomonas flavescens]|uniref:septal ring lytic transglycosylase RlpA family protein n=1 Tax=Marinomonas flavescens TaxID=2529379 RepID=UPI0030B80259